MLLNGPLLFADPQARTECQDDSDLTELLRNLRITSPSCKTWLEDLTFSHRCMKLLLLALSAP